MASSPLSTPHHIVIKTITSLQMQKIFLVLAQVYLVMGGQYDHYPKVPKTASINGFADPIYADLPEAAKECVKLDTGITPCPYWDTGCFCVMANWSGIVGKCIAENCAGDDVEKATSLALSLCDRVGASTWLMPQSVTSLLSVAREKAPATTTGGLAEKQEMTSTSSSGSLMSTSTTAAPPNMSTSMVSKSASALKEKASSTNGAEMVVFPGLLGLLAILL